MIIGITGGTGSGKTTLLELIGEKGGTVLDCDRIYHRLLETDQALLAAIEARFPGTVEQGRLLRKKLGSIVFQDTEALEALNRITHSAVRQEVLRLLKPAPVVAAIDAIGLFESGLDQLCDVTVAVIAPTEQRVQRLMEREGISREYALARIAAQPDGEKFERRCEHTLVNDGTKQEFQEKCQAFLKEQVRFPDIL